MAHVLPKIKGRRPIRDNILEESMSGSRSIPGSPGLSKRNDFMRRQATSIPKSMTFRDYEEELEDDSRIYKASHETSYECSSDYNITKYDKNTRKNSDSGDTSSEEYESNCILREANRTDKSPPKVINECNTRPNVTKTKINLNETNNTSCSEKYVNIFGIFVMVIAIASSFYTFPKDNGGNDYVINISNIRKKFPSQDEDTWSVIRSGLENVIQNDMGKVTVFLFLSSNSDQIDTLNELSIAVANIAAEGLGAKSPIILSESDILSLPKEQGYFIHKYKPALEERKVLLIRDLHKVPANVARSFHYFCDSEEPLVKRSVIIFTMHVPDISNKDEILTKVENALQALWSKSLSDNIIHPLITRLTSSIAAVTPELIYYKSSIS